MFFSFSQFGRLYYKCSFNLLKEFSFSLATFELFAAPLNQIPLIVVNKMISFFKLVYFPRANNSDECAAFSASFTQMLFNSRWNAILCFRYSAPAQQLLARTYTILNFFCFLQQIIVDFFGDNRIFPGIL